MNPLEMPAACPSSASTKDPRSRAAPSKSSGLLPASTGPDEAQYRAVDLLSQRVRAQAYTLAIADGFILIGWMVVAYLLLMLLLRPGKISYKDLRNMQ